METAIKVIGKNKCTGCFACANICPIKGAIEIKLDEEGFYKPIITDKCIHCGKCQTACPVIDYKSENELEHFYGAWSLDKEILKNSSSGGIFSECAKEIFKENGVVYGAGWEDGQLKHMPIESKEELFKLQGSKYIQSNIGNTYQLVEKDLKNDRFVLFVGVACQVAGLYKFLKKDYENLLTIDLICHGVPSTKVFYKHIKELSDKKFIKTNFRDKCSGWETYSQSYYFEEKKEIINKNGEDLFFRGFLKDLYLNTACYHCSFKGGSNGNGRVADITLADFWGVPKELYNNLGVSLVGTNNKKGQNFLEKIKGNIFFKEVSSEVALKSNSPFYKSVSKNPKRDLFFKDIDKYTLDKLGKKYFPKRSLFRKILSFCKRILKKILVKLGVLK